MMTKEQNKIVVLITTATVEEAHSIANLLLTRRKAACVNIMPRVGSLFWWQSKIEEAEESLLIVKTRKSLLTEIVDMVKKAHSYQVPEIIALPIIGGNEEYLKWIDETTSTGE